MSLHLLRDGIVQSAIALTNHEKNYQKLLKSLNGLSDPSSARVLKTLQDRLDASVMAFAASYENRPKGL